MGSLPSAHRFTAKASSPVGSLSFWLCPVQLFVCPSPIPSEQSNSGQIRMEAASAGEEPRSSNRARQAAPSAVCSPAGSWLNLTVELGTTEGLGMMWERQGAY